MRRCAELLPVLLAAGMCGCGEPGAPQAESQGTWEASAAGVVVSPATGEFRRVRLEVIDDGIVRVTATPAGHFENLPDTLMIVADAGSRDFSAGERDGTVTVETSRLLARVSLADGAATFLDPEGRVLLAEAGRSLAPVTADPGEVDRDSFAVRQQFERAGDEAYYGLGQQQDGRVDYAGANVELTTHNIEIAIPFLVSSSGYGILWNNSSITRVGDPAPPRPLSEAFDLFDARGEPGGLTARYYEGEDLKLERREADPDYQYLAHGSTREHSFPPEVQDAGNLRVEWEGTVVPKRAGRHTLKMYSSGHASLTLDGRTLLDRWRMNWNPWYHDAAVGLEAGRRYPLRIDWQTEDGYFRLLAHAPRDDAGGRLSIASETGKAADYYFVAGDSADEAIAGYRRLTGKAVLLPKWAFGFWQSRERYRSQEELIGVLEEYRERGIPIDNIVLDWFYWPEDAWGSHAFDEASFPDPQAMVDRVHELDARIMISVWPKFYPATDHYRALDARGCMFNRNIEEENYDWVGPGYPNAFYDAFDADCRALYWSQVRGRLDTLGFDAWWLDAVEPDMHSNLSVDHRKSLMTPNALGTGAEYFNAYALPHAEAIYRGLREAHPDTRAFILTRSGFGGIQRTGAAIWSGDVVTRWSNLKDQIAAGIGAGLAGMPYWTHDIGGFTPEDRYRYGESGPVGRWSEMAPAHRAEWQEINLRWFQFGAFSPLFRSHGQNPHREIFNLADEGSEVYDGFVWYVKLRYRLMPYIYTLAGGAWHEDGTIMRGLVMDFPNDPRARDIATQYMFGPAFLVAPVYEFRARSREVYLPAGADWYDFQTGDRYRGGTTIEAAAPLARMPLFVRAGSIVPVGPDVQHTGQNPGGPLTLLIYSGADGCFELYEDDGVSYDYEQGAWSRIAIRYDDASGDVRIAERVGGFDEMASERQIALHWVDGPNDEFVLNTEPDVVIRYEGEAVSVERPR